jgi:hypothetical protein
MPTGWFHGAHGGRVLILHTNSSLRSEVSTRLLALADGEFDSFHQWLLPPATSFEQKSREEDVTFLVDQLARWRARNNVGSVGVSTGAR